MWYLGLVQSLVYLTRGSQRCSIWPLRVLYWEPMDPKGRGLIHKQLPFGFTGGQERLRKARKAQEGQERLRKARKGSGRPGKAQEGQEGSGSSFIS